MLWDREVLVYSLVHAWCSDGRGKDITSVVTAKDRGEGEVLILGEDLVLLCIEDR